jgi:excisionase family DNA binding protein
MSFMDLLTVAEAARRLDVDPQTVRRWIADGRISAIALPSGQYRLRLDVVEAILEAE